MKTEAVRPTEAASLVAKWLSRIENAENYFEDWRKKGEKILRRYRGEFAEASSKADLNLFWANIQILQPALYARTPKVKIKRRFLDRDPVKRAASQIIERAGQFQVQENDFDEVMKDARDDYLLVGRGQAWVRYVPTIEASQTRVQLQVQEVDGQRRYYTEDTKEYAGEVQEDDTGPYGMVVEEDITYERVIVDYVPWRDFLHEPARQWTDVTWVAKRVYLTKKQAKERFGDVALRLKYEESSLGSKDKERKEAKPLQGDEKACIWEIWDKDSETAIWVAPCYQDAPLDQREDPLKLRRFFPCPKPLLSPSTTDTLEPQPDFLQFQDQQQSITELTTRIDAITQAIKVTGAYNAQFDQLAKLLDSGVDLTLLPVEDWATFAASGGFKGATDLLDIAPYVQALKVLYEAREREKQDYYEMTGIADILRGSSNPNETATAQQIKGQYANLRLSDRQGAVQRFAADIVQIMGEIIAEHFSPDTIRAMVGVDAVPDLAQNFEAALQLLQNDTMRTFALDIETDSTIAIDEGMQKQEAQEFASVFGTLMKEGFAAVQTMPGAAPLIGEVITWVLRRYHAASEIEPSLEDALSQLQEQLKNPPQKEQAPDPKMVQAQTQGQVAMQKLQLEAQKLQADMQKAFAQLQAQQQTEAAKLAAAREQWMAEMQMVREQFFTEQQQKAYQFETQNQRETLAALQPKKQLIKEKVVDGMTGDQMEMHREIS